MERAYCKRFKQYTRAAATSPSVDLEGFASGIL